MTVLASAIIDRVRNQLIDTSADQRWSDDELLSFLSEAQKAVVAAIPVAYTKTINHPLIAGTRQPIPADGYVALTVMRNVDGRAVTPVPRTILDMQYPDWHTEDPEEFVRHFFVEPNDPRAFYCYPPSDGLGQVVIVYSAVPADVTSLSDTLSLEDIYTTALFDFVMYRAHQKDGDYAAGQGVAAGYLAAFAAFLNAQRGSETEAVGASGQ